MTDWIYTAHQLMLDKKRMQKMKNLKRLALVLCLISVVVACGQKGDLYLPEGKALISLFG
ncbi:MAG: LPS translocon maturation chaperone LptM [Methylophagaceae bacterium]